MTVRPFDLLRATVATPDYVVSTNHVRNPSFESSLTGWAAAGVVTLQRVSSSVGLRQFVARSEATGTVNTVNNLIAQTVAYRVPVAAGEVWSFGMRAAKGTASATDQIRFIPVGVADTQFALTTVTADIVQGTMTTVKAEGIVIPEGVTEVTLCVRRGLDSNPPVGARWIFDGFQAHRGPTLPDYFDGATPADAEYAYRWTGDPDNSTSEKLRPVTDLTGACQVIDIDRGGTTEGRILAVQTGTCNVSLLGDYSHVQPNAELIVDHRQVTGRLFTGRVQDVSVVYTVKAGRRSAHTVITATDAVATLANTMRYGVVGAKTPSARLGALMASAPEVPTAPLGTVLPELYPRLADLVYESTLANHLDLLATSLGQAWWVDRDGLVNLGKVLGQALTIGTNGPCMTDGSRGSTPTNSLFVRYQDVRVSRSTRDQVTSVSVVNHARRPDPDDPGNYLADDTNHGPFEDGDAVAVYGRRNVTLDTSVNLADDDANWPDPTTRIPTLAAWWLSQFRAVRRPTWVRVNALDWYRVDSTKPAARVAARLAEDLGDCLPVDFEGVRYWCYITAVRHRVTPESWHAEYDLGHLADPTPEWFL